MMEYTLRRNGSPAVPLHELGIDAASLSLRVLDINSLILSSDTPFDGTPIFESGDAVRLFADGTCRFVGEIVATPLDTDVGSGSAHRYTARCFLDRLRRIQYYQFTNAFVMDISTGTPTLTECPEACVVLGRTSEAPFEPLTNTGQVAAILDFAIGKDVPISRDALWPEGAKIPFDERENITCWEALLAMLRWTPDHILWVDYSSGAPVVRLRQQELLNIVTLSANVGEDDTESPGLDGISFNPRHDLVMRGLKINYRRIDDIDGTPSEVRFLDSAGDPGDPMATLCYIDLQGGSYQSIKQEVKVMPFPEDWTGADAKIWLSGRVKWLGDLPPGDWSIKSHVSSGFKNLPSELTEGALYKWMRVAWEKQTHTFTVAYQTKDSAGIILEDGETQVPIVVSATDAKTKLYTSTGSIDSGEEPPEGLAAYIYAAWSLLQWDGSFSSDVDETGWVVPGMRVNITGGPTPLATMEACVQDTDIDLWDGGIRVRCGTSRMLDCDTFVGLQRALRSRRWSYRANTERVDGEAPGGIPGADAFPGGGGGGSSPALERRRLVVGSANGDRKITLEPNDLTDILTQLPQEAKFRTLAVLCQGPTLPSKWQVRRIKFLCTEGVVSDDDATIEHQEIV